MNAAQRRAPSYAPAGSIVVRCVRAFVVEPSGRRWSLDA